jgi:hypothetical protein
VPPTFALTLYRNRHSIPQQHGAAMVSSNVTTTNLRWLAELGDGKPGKLAFAAVAPERGPGGFDRNPGHPPQGDAFGRIRQPNEAFGAASATLRT